MKNDSGLENGNYIRVTGGRHKRKDGTVKDLHLSKGGNWTLTVETKDGQRFKTLAKNVELVSENQA